MDVQMFAITITKMPYDQLSALWTSLEDVIAAGCAFDEVIDMATTVRIQMEKERELFRRFF